MKINLHTLTLSLPVFPLVNEILLSKDNCRPFFSLGAAKKRLSLEVTARSVLPQFFARFSHFCATRSTFAFAFPFCTLWPVSLWSVTNEGCVRNPRRSLFIGFENFTVMNAREGFITKHCEGNNFNLLSLSLLLFLI